MANVERDNEQWRNEALLEVSNLLEMAQSVPNIVDPEERSVTLSTITAMFEGMANDEGGPDGVWNSEETEVILDSLCAAEPNNKKEAIWGLVQFLMEILE